MTESGEAAPPPRRRPRWRLPARLRLPGRRHVAVALLLLGLAVLSLLGAAPGARLEADDRTRVTELRALVGRLAEDARVVIAFDPDIGTYPEIRPAVRRLIRILAARGVQLSFASFTPEGRALAGAELAALGTGAGRGTAHPRWLSGAEAALVRFADGLDTETLGLLVVVGGVDMGPRSWVEQVAPRLPEVPIAAVVPTALRPELEPYRASGQLAALIATVPDLAALASVGGEAGQAPADREPPSAPLLGGMLAAIAFLVYSAARPWLLLPRRRDDTSG